MSTKSKNRFETVREFESNYTEICSVCCCPWMKKSSFCFWFSATNFLLKSIEEKNLETLQSLLKKCWLINLQPSINECVGATKYDKINKNYAAKLSARVLCLFDADRIENLVEFPDIGSFLFEFVEKKLFFFFKKFFFFHSTGQTRAKNFKETFRGEKRKLSTLNENLGVFSSSSSTLFVWIRATRRTIGRRSARNSVRLNFESKSK